MLCRLLTLGSSSFPGDEVDCGQFCVEAGLKLSPFHPQQVPVTSAKASRPGKVPGESQPCFSLREALSAPVHLWLQTPRSVVSDLPDTDVGACICLLAG